MKKNWELKSNQTGSRQIMESDGFEIATKKILQSRGIQSKLQMKEYLNPEYETGTHDPFLLDGMKDAVQRTEKARKQKEKVCIFGDYDADGVTSSTLLSDFFSQIGIDFFVYIPDRNLEGYGLNKKAINYISSKKAKLIITVDCGISNKQEIEYAKKQKIDVIVLDHHPVHGQIPSAFAVINPKKETDSYPEKNLAGVGVAFKFVQAFSKKIPEFDQQQLKWFLDLVAIGTVSDCVPLLGENRILTKFGLVVLGKTKRVGLRQLFHVGRININEYSTPTSQQIGFQIGPRINASGRIDHANTSLNLLNCKPNQEAEARLLALEIEDKNKYRQKITQQIIMEVENNLKLANKKPVVIIERSTTWEFGVVGLAAGKIAEKYGCPTIIFHQQDKTSRGSGRSVEGINMAEIVNKYNNILERFGGHEQAFGLEVAEEQYQTFKKKITEEMDKIDYKTCKPKVAIDCEIYFSHINSKLLNEIDLMEPFGQGNAKPLFLTRRATIEEIKAIGNGEKHLKLWLSDSSSSSFVLETIGFGIFKQYEHLQKGDKLNIIYHLENNQWNGFTKIQGILVDIEKL